MANNPFVKSIGVTAPAGVTAPSFGIPMLASYSADFFGAARSRTYSDLDAVESDWAPGTIEHRESSAFFARHPGQTARVERIVIGRGANKPTMTFAMSIATMVAGGTYAFDVAIGTITDTALAVVAGAADVAITTVTAATDLLTKVAHGLTTGTVVYISTSGVLPAATPSLAINTPYWVIRVDDDNVKLATSLANAVAGTAIDITGAGTGTHTLITTGNDVTVERIVSALNSVAGKNYTAATAGSTGSKTWTVTGSAAGAWFSVGVDHNLVTSAITHADPGIAADLSAIRNENSAWYQLHTSFNSTAMVLAGAAWVESNSSELQYSVDVSATATVNALVGAATANDVADTLRTLNRARTSAWYHPDPRQCLAAAVAGRCLGSKPGSIQLAHKQLTGVTPVVLTDTQRENLIHKDDFLGKNANSYSTFGGVTVTFYGRTSSGEWIDVVRDNDSVNSNMEAALYNLLLQNDKVPIDDDDPGGLTLIRGTMEAVLDQAVTDGIYLGGNAAPIVTVPAVSAIQSTDRRLRKVRGLKWSANLRNAAVFLESSGTVSF
jgi:hypothetical protein